MKPNDEKQDNLVSVRGQKSLPSLQPRPHTQENRGYLDNDNYISHVKSSETYKEYSLNSFKAVASFILLSILMREDSD